MSTPEHVRLVRRRAPRDVGFDPLPGPPGAPRRSIVPLNAGGSTKPLFLVPGQRGEVFHFKRLAARIRDDIPVYGFEARGLYGDAEPLTETTEIARYYISEMRSVQPQGPYLLGGFSVGGKIVYEMGRLLQQEGDPPHLLIFDYGPNRRGKRYTGLFNRILRPYRVWRFHWRNYWGLEGQRRAAYRRAQVANELRNTLSRFGIKPRAWFYAIGGTGKRTTSNNRTVSEPPGSRAVRLALHHAEDSWGEWADDPFRYPISLFRARIQAPIGRDNGALGFDDITAPGGVQVTDIPGFHEFMFVEPHLFTLVAELEDWVDRMTDAPLLAPRPAAEESPPAAEESPPAAEESPPAEGVAGA